MEEESIWTKIEMQVAEVYSPVGNTENLICRIFLKNKLKSLRHPFDKLIEFDLKEYDRSYEAVVSLEENNNEVAFGELHLFSLLRDGYGSLEQWFKLKPRKGAAAVDESQAYRIKISLNIREVNMRPPTKEELERPEGIPDCPRCSYLEKLATSQQNEMRCLEESRVSYSAIKQILEEHNEAEHAAYARPIETSLEELGIEIPEPPRGSDVSKEEAQHLKEVIIGLNDKLKALQVVQNEVKAVREQLFESQIKRVYLQDSIRDTTGNLEEQYKKISAKHSELIEQRAKLMNELLALKQQFTEKSLENDQLTSSKATLEAKLEQLRVEEFNYQNMKEHIHTLKGEQNKSLGKTEELNTKFEESKQAFDKARDAQNQNIQRLKDEKDDLRREIEALEQQLRDQKAHNDGISKENQDLDDNISKQEQALKELEEDNKSLESCREQALAKERNCIDLQEQVHKAAKQFEGELADATKVNSQLLEEKANITNELNETEDLLERRIQEIQGLTREHFALMNNTTVLEQELVVHQDREQIRKTLESQEQINQKIKDILIQELAMMSEYLEKQSGECLNISQNVISCQRVLETRQDEHHQLLELVDNLKKSKPQYVPVKEDPIDNAVAAILNARDDWYTVSFYRKAQGEYSLGTKDVNVFLNDTDSPSCRVGKGVMDLDEFLTTYVPIEANKKQVSDPSTLRQQLVASYLENK